MTEFDIGKFWPLRALALAVGNVEWIRINRPSSIGGSFPNFRC